MRSDVRERLLEVNRAFYQTLAKAFAESRPGPQPGVRRVANLIDTRAAVLDAGCGHGLAAGLLAEAGFGGRYVGIDASEDLLRRAQARLRARWATFCRADFARADWPQAAGLRDQAFDWVLAFAMLHHIPSETLRRRLIQDFRDRLNRSGMAAISVWDIGTSERMRHRTVDWSEIGLSAAEVEPGDVLVDWRSGGYGLRYVHNFSNDELGALGREAGFEVVETFRSDGDGGRMGLYHIWRRVESAEPSTW